MKYLKKFNEQQVNEDINWDKPFNFEDFEETSLDGSNFEIAIDDLILNAEDVVNSTIPKDYPNMRRGARIAIKKLWKEKIDNWFK